MTLCGECGLHLIPAEEFLGHHWRHEKSGYRACDPTGREGVWGTPAEEDEGEQS